MNKSGATLFIIAVATLISSVATAQEIIKHPVRPTSNKFTEGSELSFDQFLKVLKIDKEFEALKKDPLRYSSKVDPVFELKRIPLCVVSQLRKVAVSNTPQARLSNFNYLFYSSDVPSDSNRAKEFGSIAVPYKAGKHRLDDQSVDLRASWADLAQIKCLPTKVYLLNEPSGASVVFAEGEKAWEAEAQ